MNHVEFIIITIIFAIIAIILIKKFVPESKSTLKKILSYLIYCLFYPEFVIYIIILVFSLMNSSGEKSSSNTNGGFTIENYDILLNVNENNVVNVTENINVNFYELNHHGIYRFIPEWLEYTSKNRRKIRRKSIIENLKSTNENYHIDTVNKKRRIRIGSPYETLPKGEHIYQITYDYDMGSDPYNKYDEFIFHAYGDYWSTEIKNPTITINMPKNINKENIKFFKDKERKNNITKYMDYELNNNVIVSKYNKDKCLLDSSDCDLDSSLTVDIELPEGYFKGGSYNYNDESLNNIKFIFIVFIVVLILWLIFGKNYREKLKTIEYYPPYNLDPAQVGFIMYQSDSKKLTISLIMSLVAKKYVKIVEKNGKLYAVNLCANDKLNLQSKRILKLRKLKEFDEGVSPNYKLSIDNLFKNSNECTVGLEYKTLVKNLEEKGYIEVVEEKDVRDYNGIDFDEMEFRDINTLKPLTPTEKIVYRNLFLFKNINDLSNDIMFSKTFEEVYDELNNNFKGIVIEKKSIKVQIVSLILFFISFILCILGYFSAEDLNPKYDGLFYASYICVALTLFLTLLMKKKTLFGEEVAVKIKGFKEYLEEVEKDKLEMLVEENPNYFYDILPYTYILNISKKWIEKFEDIFKDKKIVTLEYIDIDSLVDAVISIPPIVDNTKIINFENWSDSSSNSSKGCGGGRSSGGGSRGCSSCGGGGSW